MSSFSIRDVQRNLLDACVRMGASQSLEARAEFFSGKIDRFLPRVSSILDIGGGWGFYADPLEKRGHEVTVLDVVKPSFQKAPVVIYQPGTPIPFPDKSFDVSLFVTVLHHIPDPVSVLREAARVTRRSVIVIEDIYHHALGRIWTILRDQIYNFEFFGHPRQFKKREEWLRVFEGLGWSVRQVEEHYTWLTGMRILNGIFVLDVDSK